MPDDTHLHPVDVVILRHLQRDVDYPTCIAHQCGVDQAVVDARCDRLAEQGLTEPISHEVVFRITEAGRTRLAARVSDENESLQTESADPSRLQQAGTQ